MSLDTQAYVDGLVSTCLSLGVFEAVNGYEPKSPPHNEGLTAGVWVTRLRPTTAFTALAKTSTVVTFTIRIYSNMLQEPEDAIDPNVMKAVDKVCETITGDFTLGTAVDFVDLLGQTGQMLEAQTGYVSVSNTMYRVADIFVPMVIGDTWSQAE